VVAVVQPRDTGQQQSHNKGQEQLTRPAINTTPLTTQL
jgi:hypothetical protein